MSRIVSSKAFRTSLVTLIIVGTFGIFGWYIHTHPKTITTLMSISPIALVLLTVAYCLTIVANALVLHFSLTYVKRSTPIFDNVLLTGYSSVVNFFGPLQSGPGFRAAYLKKKYGVELKKFFTATFIFYVFFALINVVVLALASIQQYASLWRVFFLIGICALIALPFLVRFIRPTKLGNNVISTVRLKDRNLWLIGAGALLLIIATCFAYYIELTQVSNSIGVGQVIVYTAAANLALFVSLTPGAIGFREAFLVLSQRLHHIDTSVIVSASIIDRAFYVVFLLALFAVLLIVHKYRRSLSIFRIKPGENEL